MDPGDLLPTQGHKSLMGLNGKSKMQGSCGPMNHRHKKNRVSAQTIEKIT
jgi:hypothetical protein